MTAVVGIMNKRGIAIAADSAVTMTRPFAWNPKIANSANKILRLSSVQPISVMITGNACFLNTPWDVIVRRYRQKWGDKSLPTMETCVNDFFRYIPTEEQLFPKTLQTEYIEDVLKSCFDDVSDDMMYEGLFIMSDPNQILKSYHSVLEKRKKELSKMLLRRILNNQTKQKIDNIVYKQELERLKLDKRKRKNINKYDSKRTNNKTKGV